MLNTDTVAIGAAEDQHEQTTGSNNMAEWKNNGTAGAEPTGRTGLF